MSKLDNFNANELSQECQHAIKDALLKCPGQEMQLFTGILIFILMNIKHNLKLDTAELLTLCGLAIEEGADIESRGNFAIERINQRH